MFRGIFDRRSAPDQPGPSAQPTRAARSGGTTPAERPSSELTAASIFAGAQQAPARSLVVVIRENQRVAVDRVAQHLATGRDTSVELIVACAGQPVDRSTIHANFRDAQFLLAPAATAPRELRRLATAQATGDIVGFVDSRGEGDPIRMVEAAPTLSVIVAVRDDAQLLAETLGSIAESSLARDEFEVIVVDDASRDGSAGTGAQFADTLVRLGGRARGAAYARNRGAELARGDILVFVDAGVRVPRNALAALRAVLDHDQDAAAVTASNDGSSGDGGVPTQFWNLLQHRGTTAVGDATIHFSSACGAVRREPFLAVGMFDEWRFHEASIEDRKSVV